MPHITPKSPRNHPPKSAFVMHEGKRYALHMEPSGWRLRRRSKTDPLDFRTGTTNLHIAEQKAKEWLQMRGNNPMITRKGGGTLEALASIYLTTPKRTKANVGKDNVSRLRVICRLVADRELKEVTCREISPDFWQSYQKAALAASGHSFDLTTRRRENIAINSAVRAARCLFLPALIRAYRAVGLETREDAGQAVMLPEPYVAPSKVDDTALLEAWEPLEKTNFALWMTIGLARFAGMRREEIANCRGGWIEEKNNIVSIVLKDRPEEKWWTKTGKPYRAQVIHPELAKWLSPLSQFEPDKLIVPDPSSGDDRGRWFERCPQEWLHAHGVKSLKPLHRLRGLYADHIAALTADAITAKLAGIKAAQSNLGHTSSATTEHSYLTPDALR